MLWINSNDTRSLCFTGPLVHPYSLVLTAKLRGLNCWIMLQDNSPTVRCRGFPPETA
jgi:hypothetical protein